MTRVMGWLRLLLLASLLAWPRFASGPADAPTSAAWLPDDGLPALAARPAQHLRLFIPSLARGASPYRSAVFALSALPPLSLGRSTVPGDCGSILQFRSAAHGAGSRGG